MRLSLLASLFPLLTFSSFVAATHCTESNQYWNWNKRGGAGCSPCPNGQVSLTGESPICHVPCSTSQYWKNDGNNSGCRPCGTSLFSHGGTDQSCNVRINCSVDQLFNRDANSCQSCPSGFKSSGGQDRSCNVKITPPPSCSTSEYLCGESHVCKKCPDGQTSTGGSASSCSTPSLNCDVNQFINRKLLSGRKECKQCPSNASSPGGSVESCNCAGGKAWNGLLDICIDRCLLPNQDWSTSENKCVCSSGFSFCSGACRRSCATAGLGKRSLLDVKEQECEKKRGHSWCPVVGTSGFECVDALAGLETCGGCAIPPNQLDLYISAQTSIDSFRFVGEDCSSIAHADGVSCLNGSCLVESCEAGFVPNDSHSACISA